MPLREFDIAIIGGGPGGYVAAIRASQPVLRLQLLKSSARRVCLNWDVFP